MRQPAPVTAWIQPGVKFGWAQALLAPPKYTPIVRYGEAAHAAIAASEGAVHVSKPSVVDGARVVLRGAARRAPVTSAADGAETDGVAVTRRPSARTITRSCADHVATTITPTDGTANAVPDAGASARARRVAAGPRGAGSMRSASVWPMAAPGHTSRVPGVPR